MSETTVEIWSDLVCPWCYLGKRRFETALASFEHRDAIQVRWRSFELDPHAPRQVTATIPERMRRDLGVSDRLAEQQLAHVTSLAEEAGLTYRLDQARPVNSFDAHRVMHYADEHGLGGQVRERLMSAYTADGADIGDRETLAELAGSAGLDRQAVRQMLDSDRYSAAVRRDEDRGRALGVSGVPTFVVDKNYGVSGARPVETFHLLLQRAWDDQNPR